MFQKYWAIFKISLSDSFQYKAHGLIYTAFDIIPLLISMVYWSKAYLTQTTIGGYQIQELISYFLLVGVTRTLLISYPEFNLQRDINQGNLNHYLLKPLSFIKHSFLSEFSFKFVRGLFSLPSFFLLSYLTLKLTHQLPHIYFNPVTLLFLILSFTLVFMYKFTLGLSAIWTTDIGWLISLNDLVMLILSGTLLPLEFFPEWFQSLSHYLPFQYFIYIPVRSLQGNLSANDIQFHLVVICIWTLITYMLYRFTWRQGQKAYTAYGS